MASTNVLETTWQYLPQENECNTIFHILGTNKPLMETVHKSMSFDWGKALIQRIHEFSSLNTMLFCHLSTAMFLCIYEVW